MAPNLTRAALRTLIDDTLRDPLIGPAERMVRVDRLRAIGGGQTGAVGRRQAQLDAMRQPTDWILREMRR